MRSAVAIANYYVAAAQRDAVRDLTAFKLHALVYLAHGWLLGASGKPLLDGKVMACRDGILIPELKDADCWGTKNTLEPITLLRLDETRGMMTESAPQLRSSDPALPAVQWVWKTYGTLTSFNASKHVRELGSPWDLIWNDEERESDEPQLIPNTTIRVWFRQLTSKRKTQGTQYQLSETQQHEQKPKLGDTQQFLAQPDPDRLRSA